MKYRVPFYLPLVIGGFIVLNSKIILNIPESNYKPKDNYGYYCKTCKIYISNSNRSCYGCWLKVFNDPTSK